MATPQATARPGRRGDRLMAAARTRVRDEADNQAWANHSTASLARDPTRALGRQARLGLYWPSPPGAIRGWRSPGATASTLRLGVLKFGYQPSENPDRAHLSYIRKEDDLWRNNSHMTRTPGRRSSEASTRWLTPYELRSAPRAATSCSTRSSAPPPSRTTGSPSPRRSSWRIPSKTWAPNWSRKWRARPTT